MRYTDHPIILKPSKVFDPQTALSLAVLCALSYKEPTEISIQIKRWKLNQPTCISVCKSVDINTQCFVTSDKDNIIIAFRGSQEVQDWLSDFQAVRDPGPLKGTKAHGGIQDALYPAVIKLTNAIDVMRDNNQKIWLTGHSLGGALCSLYAGMLIENDYPVYGIYTFASPRPGNAAFAEQLNAKVLGPHHRVVNENDIVPHLPPEPFFSHPGNRIILRTDFSTAEDETTWWQQRVNALEVFVEKVTEKFDVIDNHTLMGDEQSYIPKLVALTKNQ
ncbi:lipase family protein [Catenovulum sp. SM1970]|uniref:lipase family protein n=1 Tax=Marinifaba aquimaris TaxID=2741323 RepID=UPI0015720AFF|nr:lipase family protein [Marinifaba aquimaris]NTS75818.1 lipase family protein [Marinifaba aquimaris]